MKKFSEKNLEQLGFDSISVKIYAEREINGINESFEKWEKWNEYEEKYTRNVTGIIIGNEDFEPKLKIGQIRGTFFEAEAQIKDTNFWEVCDSISGDLEYMAEVIVDEHFQIKEEVCTMNNSIFYLDEIFIDEPYRSHGIGKFVLENIDKFMLYTSNLEVGSVITYPYAMEGNVEKGYKGIEEEPKKQETLKRLRKFYRNCGFKKIGTQGHMYKKYRDTFDYYQ